MSNAIKKERLEVPIWHKPFLTIEEATAYTGIGRDTLREMTRFADCPFVLWAIPLSQDWWKQVLI